jgi:hypothetical protein
MLAVDTGSIQVINWVPSMNSGSLGLDLPARRMRLREATRASKTGMLPRARLAGANPGEDSEIFFHSFPDSFSQKSSSHNRD